MTKHVICWTEATGHAVEIEADTLEEAVDIWDSTFKFGNPDTMQDRPVIIDDSVFALDSNGERIEIIN